MQKIQTLLKNNNTLFSLLIITFIGLLMSRLFGESYLGAVLTNIFYLVAVVLTVIMMVQLFPKRWHYEQKPIKYIFTLLWGILTTLMVIIFISEVINWITPYRNHSTDENTSIKSGQIYVTHHSDCEFCQVSNANMKRAVELYNITHTKDVVVVDVKHDTKLAKELDTRIEHYGSIIIVDKDGDQHTLQYTTGNLKGEPVSNSSRNIYERIQKVVEQAD